MKFRTGNLEFNATVAESGNVVSPQTGAQLKTLTIQFRAQKAGVHDQALEAAQAVQGGGLFSLTAGDVPELEWRVRDSTSQYVGSEPWGVNHHIWRIEQVERLACERLQIGAVSLSPYDYVEALGKDGSVRLAARALASDADLIGLSSVDGPVDVIRHGVSDAARRMTIEYVWGPGVDGLAVAVRCVDVPEPRVRLDSASVPGDPLGDVLVVLAARSVLSDADLSDLRARRHAARQVAAIDGWSLSD